MDSHNFASVRLKTEMQSRLSLCQVVPEAWQAEAELARPRLLDNACIQEPFLVRRDVARALPQTLHQQFP